MSIEQKWEDAKKDFSKEYHSWGNIDHFMIFISKDFDPIFAELLAENERLKKLENSDEWVCAMQNEKYVAHIASLEAALEYISGAIINNFVDKYRGYKGSLQHVANYARFALAPAGKEDSDNGKL